RAPRAVVVEELVDAVPVPRRDELQRDLARLVRAQPLLGQRDQLAVHTRAEHVTGLDVQVGCAALDRGLEDLDHAGRPLWGARAGGRPAGGAAERAAEHAAAQAFPFSGVQSISTPPACRPGSAAVGPPGSARGSPRPARPRAPRNGGCTRTRAA